MLGQVVRDARIARGFTQDKLAKLAGVSRRHLAALEKGANVSVLVVKKVAAALGLETIDLGGLTITTTDQPSRVNLPLLTESIRDARNSAIRAERMLAQAERLAGAAARPEPTGELAMSPLPLPLPLLTTLTDLGISGSLRDRASDWIELPLAAEIEAAQPMSELPPGEMLQIPAVAVDPGEAIFRVRGSGLEMWGIAEGDILITELRPDGKARTGELVIAIDEGVIRIGRWWNKRGAHRIQASPDDRAADAPETTPKVFGAINHVLRM
jgi:transcriptional regulator with XRE-family HTH domain